MGGHGTLQVEPPGRWYRRCPGLDRGAMRRTTMAMMPRERFIERAEERAVISTGTRPVVGWSGVFAGLVVGAGVVGLLSVLGVAVGITVLPDARMASGEGGARLGLATGVGAALSLLAGCFVGG